MGRTHVLRRETRIERPIDEVFAFFGDALNLERITPPELRFRILTATPIEMRPGARIEYRLSLFGVPFKWETAITAWEPPHRFVDEQLRGPYRQWVHTHSFRAEGSATVISDEVVYALPFAPLGELAGFLVRRQLARIFTYRQRAIERLLTGGVADE